MATVWEIRGFDGDQQVYLRQVPRGQFSESEMAGVLQRLAARHLTDDEVVSSSLRRGAIGRMDHLEVDRDGGARVVLMTAGSGHYYVAAVMDA